MQLTVVEAGLDQTQFPSYWLAYSLTDCAGGRGAGGTTVERVSSNAEDPAVSVTLEDTISLTFPSLSHHLLLLHPPLEGLYRHPEIKIQQIQVYTYMYIIQIHTYHYILYISILHVYTCKQHFYLSTIDKVTVECISQQGLR